jgi:sigma-B regulation protein RsbU (phosphoserine phosphatase)
LSTDSAITDAATNETTTADYRRLMKKVEEVVGVIREGENETTTIHLVADEVIRQLRSALGIFGGRLYQRDGDSYVLRATFPDAKAVAHEFRVPRTYPPLELCLLMGTVYMGADDPRIDPELERALGVEEFAAVEVGDEDYVLGFNVAPGHNRDDVIWSLAVVRRAIDEKIHRQRVEDIFEQAQQIQASILPRRAPVFAGYDVAGRTSSMHGMGGDLFDFIPLSEKLLGITIADASGHGLPAALQVRDVYVGLRMGLSRDFKIVRTVERLNEIIHRSSLKSRFVSTFYAELESNGNFIYVNAGHPPPFHIAAGGEVTRLIHGGPVLGPLPSASYERGMVSLAGGDMVVLYTDGITEALASGDTTRREEYGVHRLLEVLRAHQGEAAAAILDAVFASVEAWTEDTPPQDDRTVVVVTCPS